MYPRGTAAGMLQDRLVLQNPCGAVPQLPEALGVPKPSHSHHHSPPAPGGKAYVLHIDFTPNNLKRRRGREWSILPTAFSCPQFRRKTEFGTEKLRSIWRDLKSRHVRAVQKAIEQFCAGTRGCPWPCHQPDPIQAHWAQATPHQTQAHLHFPTCRVAARTEAFCALALIVFKLFEVEKHYK